MTMRVRSQVAATVLLALVASLLIGPGARRAVAEPVVAEPVGTVGEATVERFGGADRVGTAIEVAQQLYETATAVVLARSDEFADALVGAPLATQLRGPILLTAPDGLSPGVAEEIDRLQPEEVVLLGGEGALSPGVVADLGDRPARRVQGVDRFATAAAVAGELPPSETVFVATGEDFPDALAAAPYAAAAGSPLLLVSGEAVPAVTAAALEASGATNVILLGGTGAISEEVETTLAADRNVRRVAGPSRFETAAAVYDDAVAAGVLDPAGLWLATGANFPDALAAGPAIATLGETLLLVDGDDLCAVDALTQRLRARRGEIERIRVLGGTGVISGDALEQLAEASDPDAACRRLPRGGTRLFPDFRMVAFYGSSASPLLGVLGEGTPDEAAQRLLAQAAPYDQPGRPILPAFEFITTIANRTPGTDGDYSTPVDPVDVQRYLDAVRRIDGYMFLDFQPGRSDFLSQVRQYEQFLVQPDVGVALDPEWRMGPGQVPGESIGSVSAAEINEVSAYLADLVERHRLPEKLLVIHQFTIGMVRDKETVLDREGLAVTFHIDGFGSQAAKLTKYEQLHVEPPLHNGIKLFYDEDIDMFTPDEALGLDPTPELITYQ